GFTTGEIDLILDDQPSARDPADDLSGLPPNPPGVSKLGDEWELGRHRVFCGDPLCDESYRRLLGGQLAEMVVADPFFNIKAPNSGTEGDKLGEIDKSREKSSSNNTPFPEEFIRLAIRHSREGSIHFLFMDWKHLMEVSAAARPTYTKWMNLLVWNKSTA